MRRLIENIYLGARFSGKVIFLLFTNQGTPICKDEVALLRKDGESSFPHGTLHVTTGSFASGVFRVRVTLPNMTALEHPAVVPKGKRKSRLEQIADSDREKARRCADKCMECAFFCNIDAGSERACWLGEKSPKRPA